MNPRISERNSRKNYERRRPPTEPQIEQEKAANPVEIEKPNHT